MSLRAVGAGLGRTGTNSLKVALELLLEGPCYHMYELIERPEDTAAWERAVSGEDPGWAELLGGFRATVDFPAAVFWRELLAYSPDAIVLLSTRDSAEVWWDSFARTILPSLTGEVPADRPDWARRRSLNLAMIETRFTPGWHEEASAKDAYERHNEAVRSEVPAERLVDWRPGDGWEPICAALDIPVPGEPFPHENTAADFQARVGVEPADGA